MTRLSTARHPFQPPEPPGGSPQDSVGQLSPFARQQHVASAGSQATSLEAIPRAASCTLISTLTPKGTRVTLNPHPDARGIARILAPLIAVMIRRLNRQHLGRLRQVLEGG